MASMTQRRVLGVYGTEAVGVSRPLSHRVPPGEEFSMKSIGFTAASLVLGLAAVATGFCADAPPFKVAHRILLGGEGGWDALTMDASAHRLFVTHGTRVQVVDVKTDSVLGEIPDTPGVHGVALAPELGRGFTSNGRDGMVTVFDLTTLKPISKVKVGENPDA